MDLIDLIWTCRRRFSLSLFSCLAARRPPSPTFSQLITGELARAPKLLLSRPTLDLNARAFFHAQPPQNARE
jgi:hypothetical protein